MKHCAGVEHQGQSTCGGVYRSAGREKKSSCVTSCVADGRFWMSSGLFIYLLDISVCSRGASDNDVGD